MKKLLVSICLPTAILAANIMPSPSAYSNYKMPEREHTIELENRVLATVNDKPISLLDVQHKMDMEFYMFYPHLVDSAISRYHYYNTNWKDTFDRMVDTELLVIDAEEQKVELSDGIIRQELEKRFGPEVITNIDKLGLTYEKAWELIKKDILSQGMSQRYLIFSGVCDNRGSFNVLPKDLLQAYQKHLGENKKPDHWKYNMVSFSGPNAFEDAQLSKQKLEALIKEHHKFSKAFAHFKANTENFADKKITVTSEFDLPSNKIQPSHLNVLSELSSNSMSDPIKETSRVTKKPVYRLFFLSSYAPADKIHLSEVEQQLLEELKMQNYHKASASYITKLREQAGLQKEHLYSSIPDNFEPFKIR